MAEATAELNDLRRILCLALRLKPFCSFVQYRCPAELPACACAPGCTARFARAFCLKI